MSLTQPEREGEVVDVSHVRGSLVQAGDFRNQIGFQNDINLLLAALEEPEPPWQALTPPFRPFREGFARRTRVLMTAA